MTHRGDRGAGGGAGVGDHGATGPLRARHLSTSLAGRGSDGGVWEAGGGVGGGGRAGWGRQGGEAGKEYLHVEQETVMVGSGW